jgi:hypothetical protein
MKKVGVLVLVMVALLAPSVALAQSYSFVLDQALVDAYLQPDGTLDVLYRFTFENDPGAAWIDFVDIGLPDKPLDESGVQATVNGSPVAYVSSGEYEGDGTGVAVALGQGAIPPGERGEVVVFVPGIQNMFHPDTQDEGYASLVFSPNWFSSDFVRGNTDMQVTFHMPPGVQPNEPRWHQAPAGWASEPQVGVDDQGRVTYTWRNGVAYGFTQYKFGASVPRIALPAGAVKNPPCWSASTSAPMR